MVTRIAYSKNLNVSKFEKLTEIAFRLGKIRKEVWHRYGSISGVGFDTQPKGLTYYGIRDKWLNRQFDVPARLWKETLRDTFADICLYREATKVKVRKAIAKRTSNEQERKRFFTLLKYDKWTEDNYLRRMMRKYYKHGQTNVDNQIVLDTQCYTAFLRKASCGRRRRRPDASHARDGVAWIKVMGLERKKRIAIPLNTNRLPSGTLRLIIRNDKVEVHYAIEEEECKPCKKQPTPSAYGGDKGIGVDKGYSEVFVDSDGEVHGEGFGNLLSEESDFLKVKYRVVTRLL